MRCFKKNFILGFCFCFLFIFKTLGADDGKVLPDQRLSKVKKQQFKGSLNMDDPNNIGLADSLRQTGLPPPVSTEVFGGSVNGEPSTRTGEITGQLAKKTISEGEALHLLGRPDRPEEKTRHRRRPTGVAASPNFLIYEEDRGSGTDTEAESLVGQHFSSSRMDSEADDSGVFTDGVDSDWATSVEDFHGFSESEASGKFDSGRKIIYPSIFQRSQSPKKDHNLQKELLENNTSSPNEVSRDFLSLQELKRGLLSKDARSRLTFYSRKLDTFYQLKNVIQCNRHDLVSKVLSLRDTVKDETGIRQKLKVLQNLKKIIRRTDPKKPQSENFKLIMQEPVKEIKNSSSGREKITYPLMLTNGGSADENQETFILMFKIFTDYKPNTLLQDALKKIGREKPAYTLVNKEFARIITKVYDSACNITWDLILQIHLGDEHQRSKYRTAMKQISDYTLNFKADLPDGNNHVLTTQGDIIPSEDCAPSKTFSYTVLGRLPKTDNFLGIVKLFSGDLAPQTDAGKTNLRRKLTTRTLSESFRGSFSRSLSRIKTWNSSSKSEKESSPTTHRTRDGDLTPSSQKHVGPRSSDKSSGSVQRGTSQKSRSHLQAKSTTTKKHSATEHPKSSVTSKNETTVSERSRGPSKVRSSESESSIKATDRESHKTRSKTSERPTRKAPAHNGSDKELKKQNGSE